MIIIYTCSLPQEGAVRVQVPSVSHVLMLVPFSVYPVSHRKIAKLWVPLLLTVTLPFERPTKSLHLSEIEKQ